MMRATFHARPDKRAMAMGAALLLIVSVALIGSATESAAIDGNIAGSIEIDQPSANLFPASGGTDWVKDSLANADLVAGVNAKAGATGHWNGHRIVDGFAGGDQDIFLSGGKEDDTSTWNVGPGTVGSSKYDATQAYLASNQTKIFFGMERRGNNGTTAFDFEFNQAENTNPYIPTRTVDDVLVTFEMQGSGGSGSAVPHVYKWSGSAYVEQLPPPAGIVTSINTNTTTPAAPWGHVTNGWTGGNLERFEFAEAEVPLSILPGVDACGGSAFTQVRTRSSSTPNSDLKDTTPIFRFDFASPTATASKTSANGTTMTVNLTGSSQGITNPSSQWQRFDGTNWVNINGATATTLAYSTFGTDATATGFTNLVLAGPGDPAATAGTYNGTVYAVSLRYVASGGSAGCTARSAAVVVKKIVAVDP